MQINFRKSIAAAAIGMLVPALVSAHPGHTPADLSAQVSEPLAGPDHFLVFVALSAVLLMVLRILLKARGAAGKSAHE
jgi:hydrogenase/urease accessory protein HupE